MWPILSFDNDEVIEDVMKHECKYEMKLNTYVHVNVAQTTYTMTPWQKFA